MSGFKYVILVVLGVCLLGADAHVPLDAGVAAVDAGVTVGDVLEKGVAGVEAVKHAIDTKTLASIMGAVSAILYALIAAGRRFGAKIKGNTVRILTLVGGAVAALATNLAVEGVQIWETVLVFLAGPGSMALHETIKIVKSSSEAEETPLPVAADDGTPGDTA